MESCSTARRSPRTQGQLAQQCHVGVRFHLRGCDGQSRPVRRPLRLPRAPAHPELNGEDLHIALHGLKRNQSG